MWITVALAGLFAGAGLIIAIGAQNAFVLRQGLQRRYVGTVVLACMGADMVLILAGVGGMGALVQQWPLLLQVLRLGGAAFLLWYGLQAGLRAWRGGSALAAAGSEGGNRRQVLLACLAFTLLNPHVYLDTVVLLGSLSTRYPGALRWVFAAGACVASVAWFCALGYGARLLQPLFRNPDAWRVLDAGIAVFMMCLALLLLVSPIRA
ncbi:amino acid transporter [Stenotrophomonas sp. S48]|uniref:LysE/ArgO family amino acid transporter n=1 Tax=unclassified Stenotrophomonas TaxID=196198 RepID=UPI001902A105|nr:MULTISPECIES: LysE/ArgO family amino acid transporter [unclassified Stenotrophomonas]MBK0024721.1 amino acid transporter [Stenotrophomonas sp. S48]MBK0046941.1 amino acid transporter [Stenotrophomonas sp. S49]